MAENEVKVTLSVDMQAALAAINKFNVHVDKMAEEAKEASRRANTAFAKMNKRIKELAKNTTFASRAMSSFVGNIGANAVSALSSLAIRGFGAVVTEVVDFDKAIKEINTLLPKSAKLTGKMENELVALSRQFGTSQASQAKAFYQIISAGAASGADAIELLTQANVLATAGLADVGSATDILTDILNVYGKENITAEEAADSLFTTVRLGKTTIPQLTSAMGQVIPAAKKLNVSLDDVGAALATMTTQGLTTAERVTQLNALFTALFRKSGDAGAKFGKKVGDAFNLTALRTKGLSEFLKGLTEATGGSEVVLQKLLGRTEAVRAIFALTGNQTAVLSRNMEQFQGKAGAADDALKEMSQSLDFQFNKAVQTAINALTELATPITETVRLALIGFNALADSIASVGSSDLKNANQLKQSKKILLSLELQIVEARKRAGAENIVSQIQKEIDAEEKLIRTLQRKQEFVGPSAPTPEGPGDPVSVQKKIDAELAMLRAEKILQVEQDVLKLKEIEGLATEEELARINEIELAKISLKETFLLEKAELIETEDKKELEKQKIKAKTELELLKKGNALELAERKKQIEEDKKIAKAREQLDLLVNKQSISLASNTANLINAIAGKQTKVGFLLAKAAAAANVLIADGQARAAATAAAANAAIVSSLGGPGAALGAFNLTLGQMQSVITANTALSLGAIAASTIQGFQGGGVVGGFVGATGGGDNRTVTARTGEMFLNAGQQKELFDNISTGTAGSNNETLMAALSQDIVLIVDNREIARANRTAIDEGFAGASA